MRFKEGDKVEFIWIGELKQGVVTEIEETKNAISYQIKYSGEMGMTWLDERDLLSPAPVLKVPQCVADWYEQHRYKLEHSIWQYIYCWDVQKRKSDFYNFMKNDNLKPVETLIKMKDGYEVEKEPLYYVRLPYFGYVTNRMDYTLSQSKTDAVMLTESKIKRMDERYWKFAVLVKEAEGEA
ncbi:DUF1642 domain-containing protein [Listeria monocytogenes]|nr:DUF1642 domain-containing protein [Listeria monocytogenes]